MNTRTPFKLVKSEKVIRGTLLFLCLVMAVKLLVTSSSNNLASANLSFNFALQDEELPVLKPVGNKFGREQIVSSRLLSLKRIQLDSLYTPSDDVFKNIDDNCSWITFPEPENSEKEEAVLALPLFNPLMLAFPVLHYSADERPIEPLSLMSFRGTGNPNEISLTFQLPLKIASKLNEGKGVTFSILTFNAFDLGFYWTRRNVPLCENIENGPIYPNGEGAVRNYSALACIPPINEGEPGTNQNILTSLLGIQKSTSLPARVVYDFWREEPAEENLGIGDARVIINFE